MTRDPQRLGDYLAHMLEAIERIEEYVSDMDEMAFLGSRLVQDAVIRNFEIIGEASNHIESVFLNLWPSIPSCRFHRLISCAMRLLMDISRWTLKSSGKPSTATYRACMP